MPGRFTPVPGWEAFYGVSREAEVWTVRRTGTVGGIKKQRRDRDGYARVSLSGGGRQANAFVHQLVAAAFLGHCPPGHQVRHGPAGKADNRPGNLSYGTPTENQRDRLRDGTDNRGERHPNHRLTEAQVLAIRYRHAAGEAAAALAREYRVGRTTVRRVIAGATWAWAA